MPGGGPVIGPGGSRSRNSVAFPVPRSSVVIGFGGNANPSPSVSHEESDGLTFYYNPSPPVEFFGRGLDLDVAWLGGGTLRCTGNSFATPHIAGICALILGKHPDLTPFQLKSVLYQTASNAKGAA